MLSTFGFAAEREITQGEITMKQYRTSAARLVGLAIIASAAATAPQMSANGQAEAPNNQQAQPVPYRPGMGDFMTAGVSPRFIKLAAAGQAGNWGFAAYALKELRENFGRLVRTTPVYQSKSTAELIANSVEEPMVAVDVAIKAGDPVRFKAAYSRLTQGCNSCHEKTDRAVVVIQVPEAVTSYPDHNFRPRQ
jgi:hypothetical protein